MPYADIAGHVHQHGVAGVFLPRAIHGSSAAPRKPQVELIVPARRLARPADPFIRHVISLAYLHDIRRRDGAEVEERIACYPDCRGGTIRRRALEQLVGFTAA